ncbi:hypothetical protein MTR_7g445910 [Medicago truncatula]|uniref:Reverse transcriptase domain-containing protein n=1 Tax=Medicago truncatula TaxID=3880 RepID=A0A072U993_MEDTR|nr:hypothetical protein MTR_7g445910 [Medicago truncatula]
MEKLALSIQSKVQQGIWRLVHLSHKGPGLSHLLFADDVLLFSEATPDQTKVVMDTLNEFCIAFGRATKDTYDYILEKMHRRLSTWKANLLNKAERVCLAKSVTTAMPKYTMQMHYLPSNICHKIDRVTKSFIRGGTGSNRKWNRVKWSTVTSPKKFGVELSGIDYLILLFLGNTQLQLKDVSFNGSWDWNKLMTIVPNELITTVDQFLPPLAFDDDIQDRWVRGASKTGSFGSAREARASARHGEYLPDFQLRYSKASKVQLKSQKLRIRHALCGELRHVTREARGIGSRGER